MDRTTVDALKALGKALCGDSFEVTPGLTDAEMIFEIAKQYQPPEGGGSSSSIPVLTAEYNEDDYEYYVKSHTFDEINSLFCRSGDTFPSLYRPVIINFSGYDPSIDEMYSGSLWYCTDYDADQEDYTVETLYLGSGRVAQKPSYDREGSSDVVSSMGVKIYKNQTDAAGNPSMTQPAETQWSDIDIN